MSLKYEPSSEPLHIRFQNPSFLELSRNNARSRGNGLHPETRGIYGWISPSMMWLLKKGYEGGCVGNPHCAQPGQTLQSRRFDQEKNEEERAWETLFGSCSFFNPALARKASNWSSCKSRIRTEPRGNGERTGNRARTENRRNHTLQVRAGEGEERHGKPESRTQRISPPQTA